MISSDQEGILPTPPGLDDNTCSSFLASKTLATNLSQDSAVQNSALLCLETSEHSRKGTVSETSSGPTTSFLPSPISPNTQKTQSYTKMPPLTNPESSTSSKAFSSVTGGKFIGNKACPASLLSATPSLDSLNPTYSKLASRVKSIDGNIQVARHTPIEPAAALNVDLWIMTQSTLLSSGNDLTALKTSLPVSTGKEGRTTLELSNSLLGSMQTCADLPTSQAAASESSTSEKCFFLDTPSVLDAAASSPSLTDPKLQSGLMQGHKQVIP